MLQFHPIVLAMTADDILRIVCMRLCREPIKVVTSLPPPPPYLPSLLPNTQTHTLSTRQTSARQCCRVVSTCATCYTYAYLFQPYTDLYCTSNICIFFSQAVRISFSAIRRPVLHVEHMHTFFSRQPRSKTA